MQTNLIEDCRFFYVIEYFLKDEEEEDFDPTNFLEAQNNLPDGDDIVDDHDYEVRDVGANENVRLVGWQQVRGIRPKGPLG